VQPTTRPHPRAPRLQVLLAHFLCGRRKPGGWDSGVVMQGQLLVFSGCMVRGPEPRDGPSPPCCRKAGLGRRRAWQSSSAAAPASRAPSDSERRGWPRPCGQPNGATAIPAGLNRPPRRAPPPQVFQSNVLGHLKYKTM
jgi:hypothetical protein